MPALRRPATNVVVRRWPNGAASITRSLRRPSKATHTMLVVALVSSRNTKEAGSMNH